VTLTVTKVTGRSPAGATAPAPPRPGRVTLRLGPVSVPVDRRVLLVSLVLAGVAVVAVAWSAGVGQSSSVPLGEVFAYLTGQDVSRRTSQTMHVRLPRILTGALVGAALGASGQIFQRLVRNPLASPDILGVSAGAAVAAVAAIVLWSMSSTAATIAALVGAVAAVVAIYLLAFKQGVSSYRLVLVGIGLTSMLEAVVAWMVTRAQINDAQRAAVWLTGSLNERGWEHVGPLSVALVVLLPLALVAGRSLRTLELGDDNAAALGVRVRGAKLVLALLGAALAAVATAAAGPVAFVALVAPQIARRLVGARAIAVLPAALVGAILLVDADLFARRVFAPVELPVGVVTAVIGAPYLLWLLARANSIGSGG
jgi:iron complex transport system permease protein